MTRTVVLLLTAVFALGLAGCVVRGPEVEVRPPVEIRTQTNDRFCPPGQAKKGNC